MIKIENLVKRYGKLVALDHLNLEIEEGEIYGLLGPNGSGKTTAISCMLALLKYDKGTVSIFGEEMRPDNYGIKQQIGIVLQNVAVFDELTVYENIDYFCGLYVKERERRKKLVLEAIHFVGLEDYIKMRPKKLSGGLLRRLNIACGIAHKPRLIIMDEPTVAVDPQSRNRILEGIHAADGGAGVLLIIKNYSGDIMNFQMAAELAQMEGIRTECVVVKDDVAVPDSTYSAGRRGIAGTVLVHKIAGAAAEPGKNLDEVKRIAEKVIVNLRSMGMAMSPCILPAVGKPGFSLGETEVEIGMGIHGEPGICREDLTPAAETAKTLLSRILEDFDYSKSETAMLVNGLGGTPLMELYIMSRELTRILREKGITAVRTIVGNYMTSLEMAGCSVTLLKLDEELKALLAAPADTPAFKC